MVYTDESIKSAKDDKAALAKVKKMIEDQRKAYKAKSLLLRCYYSRKSTKYRGFSSFSFFTILKPFETIDLFLTR